MIPPQRREDPPRLQFSLSTLLLTTLAAMLLLGIFAALGVTAELLWGLACLALAPVLLLLTALLQYPWMRWIARDADDPPDDPHS